MTENDLSALEKDIAYSFKNTALLKTALTHPSCGLSENYERLEFLGDAVLELLISEKLFKEYHSLSEGVLTQKRADIVCARSLVKVANTISLGSYLRLGKGEETSGGREKPSILENALEALLGAIYIDGGFDAAKKVVSVLFAASVKAAMAKRRDGDYKSHLQEKIQGSLKQELCYKICKREGPPHNTTFYVDLYIGGEKVCQGMGGAKKEAEQNAAKKALDIFNTLKL